eukprot:3708149-Pleurochrysis_carterae.AAC.1
MPALAPRPSGDAIGQKLPIFLSWKMTPGGEGCRGSAMLAAAIKDASFPSSKITYGWIVRDLTEGRFRTVPAP